ncbi:MAG: tetratricopeptide repeat protein [Bacillota bacterium]
MREDTYKKEYPQDLIEKYEEAVDELNMGKIDEGQKQMQEIIDRETSFAPAYNKLAVLYIRQKEKEKARQILHKALEIDPEFPPALTNMGSLEKEAGNTQKAKELYQKAIDLNSEYGPAYNNLGVVLREEGEVAESVKYLKKARKLGTFTYSSIDEERPIYKDPGCMIPIVIAVIFILLTIFWFWPVF